VFHNVLIGGELGTGSEYSDNHDLDFNSDDLESTGLDGEQDEVRFGGVANAHVMPPHSTSHGFPPSALPFQSNRPGLLSWNASRRSSAASSSTAPIITSFSPLRTPVFRRAGVFAKKQGRAERNSRSSDKPESASPLSQAELGDYLIGWSRYCASLRVVQIDHRWWWERRFAGDQWAFHVHHDSARTNDKGKEREGAF
jgi:hypothetical protein